MHDIGRSSGQPPASSSSAVACFLAPSVRSFHFLRQYACSMEMAMLLNSPSRLHILLAFDPLTDTSCCHVDWIACPKLRPVQHQFLFPAIRNQFSNRRGKILVYAHGFNSFCWLRRWCSRRHYDAFGTLKTLWPCITARIRIQPEQPFI